MEGASTEATDMVSSKLSRHVGVIRDSLGVKNVVHLISVSWSILWIHEKLFGAPGNRTPLTNKKMQTLIFLILVIVVAWVLFRPFSKNELERHKDKDWPDMNL